MRTACVIVLIVLVFCCTLKNLKRWTLDNVITLTSDHRMIRTILWMFRARARIVLCANHLFP